MAIITVDKASLAFGHHILLDKISFGIEKFDKIGLIGRNGAGKSSLLKAIANEVALDDGRIYAADGIKVVYVAQEPTLTPTNTIFEEVLSGLGEVKDSLTKYYAILDELDNGYTDELLDQLHVLQEKLEQNNGFVAKNAIDKILSELKIDGNKIISTLSGGLKKKVSIARAIVANPDVMLLDEPTNHLDIEAITILEQMINNFKGAVFLITHDRWFLDKTVNKIMELDRGKLTVYPASYKEYQVLKEEQLAQESKINREFDKFLAEEEVWIRKGIQARRTRNEGRVRRLQELREQRSDRREQLGKVNFKVDSSNLSGKIVAELNNISLTFKPIETVTEIATQTTTTQQSTPIVKDFSTIIMRGDKIGLIGSNGIGKTTLLKMILGELTPTSGSVKLGTKLEIAYFDQLREQLDENKTVQDVVSQGEDYVEVNGRRLHIATYLEEFLFAPARFRSPIKSLSGGERNRLLLARLFSRPANVLVLDEPTNDLDVETLELLEELLINYSGTVFLISHDRAFLDNVVTESWVFLGDGEILEIAGGYSDWLNYRDHSSKIQDRSGAVKNVEVKKSETNTSEVMADMKSKSPKRKLSYKETQELESLPKSIESLEHEQAKLQELLLDVNLYKNDPKLAQTYQARIVAIENELSLKLSRWEELGN
jgi:ATP-binding cassette subfamily F protein uup